jgi:hypothetical protein
MTIARNMAAGLVQALPDVSPAALSRGILCCGAPGVGKSRFLGRRLAIKVFAAEIGQIIIDPTGGTIDNFLDKVVELSTYLPRCEAAKLFARIVYCDMSGRDGFVVPWPFYYRLGHERSLWEISERFVQVIRKSDPALLTRPIMGWPPLHKIGVYTGMVLAALGYQITEAESLLFHPEQWHDRLQQAENRYPTVKRAVAFFRDEYIPMRKAERERLTNPFLEKIFPIGLDQRLQAIFGAETPGINLNGVQRNGTTVLLDWRHVLDTDMKRFQLLWVLTYLLDWIKQRGRSRTPFGLIIDEFPQMAVNVSAGENPLASDFDTLIHAYMRSSQIWLTIGLQSPLQLDAQLQETVLSLGTYLIGQAPTPAAARLLADAIYLRKPYWVKHYRNVWGRWRQWDVLEVIDREPEYMPLDQQTEIFANRIRSLSQYQFLVRPAVDEGTIDTEVFPFSISMIDPGKFPDQEILTPLRKSLAIKSGRPVAALIKEQEARVRQASVTHAAHPRRRVSEQPPRSLDGTDAPAEQPAEERPRRLLQRRYL